jgi:plasmid rolling circle replication initiator protein Rep
MKKNNTKAKINQDQELKYILENQNYNPKYVLRDYSSTGKLRPWREKKVANTYLSMAYTNINKRKAERLCECARFLIYKVLPDGSEKLDHMNSCRVRLCPMCNWRRSLKTFANMMKVVDAIEAEKEHAFLFLHLTIRNCQGSELSKTLDLMNKSWERMFRRKEIKAAVKGWYRAIEVTHNIDEASPSYDTYHPHMHCILTVPKNYFKKYYIDQEDWLRFWRESLRVDYDPGAHIELIQEKTPKAIAECAKYAVKESDYIIPEDWKLTEDTVRILDVALHKRRFISYGGLMKEVHKRLNLSDDENGDLTHIDEDKPAEDKPTEKKLVYAWNTGYFQYMRQE